MRVFMININLHTKSRDLRFHSHATSRLQRVLISRHRIDYSTDWIAVAIRARLITSKPTAVASLLMERRVKRAPRVLIKAKITLTSHNSSCPLDISCSQTSWKVSKNIKGLLTSRRIQTAIKQPEQQSVMSDTTLNTWWWEGVLTQSRLSQHRVIWSEAGPNFMKCYFC